ncbi:MAG TPA: hypothetical protein VM222_07160 [Planctomycetota bacterium]|nr:hypothetical protein [Planctomycetota bacterium]
MKNLRAGIILCSTLLLLSGFFIRKTAELPVPAKAPAATPAISDASAVVALPADAPALALPASATTSSAVVSHKAGASEAAALAPQDEDLSPYPGSRVDPKVILALHGTAPLNAQHPHMAAAIAVQERYTKELMANPAVVGTSVGLNDDGQVAVLVLTKTDSTGLPANLDQIPVVVWKTGEVFARNRPDQDGATTLDRAREQGKSSGARPASVPLQQTRFDHPVPIGVSTSLPSTYTAPYITAGTLGCRVTDGSFVYALSNNHVFANESLAPKGAILLQPGTLDKGVNGDFYGNLDRWSTIVFSSTANNVVDAAVAVSDTGSLGNSTPAGGYGTPSSSVVAPAATMAVTKYGRTTGQTSASISGINSTILVSYDRGNAQFIHQVMISSRTFSDGGDSGSLIVTSVNQNPVGLLFAGGRTATFANPIQDVLNTFGVTIDGK